MHRLIGAAVAGMICLGTSATAAAQETVDIGVIKESDITVVQKLLYPKAGRTELGVHLGWMPFDGLITTPNGQLSFDNHFTEDMALSVLVGGGYGLKNARYVELENPPYQAAPDAYRYLASALVGFAWSPIYAKLNLDGSTILHHDVYAVARGGATLERSVLQGGPFAVAPTVSVGLGARLFLGGNAVLRIELRDDLLIETRGLTKTTHLKQNADITVGFTMLSPIKERRR